MRPLQLVECKMMMKWCVRAGRKKKRHLLAGGDACFRIIMNTNTGSTMQLSPNYWLCPEGWEDWTERTRPTSTAGLSHPLCLDSPHIGVVQQRTIWQLHPSAWRRSRRLQRERAERGRKSIWYIAGKVIWNNVWQWAVGFWNVPWVDLHILL